MLKQFYQQSVARFIFSKRKDYVEQVTTGCGVVWMVEHFRLKLKYLI